MPTHGEFNSVVPHPGISSFCFAVRRHWRHIRRSSGIQMPAFNMDTVFGSRCDYQSTCKQFISTNKQCYAVLRHLQLLWLYLTTIFVAAVLLMVHSRVQIALHILSAVSRHNCTHFNTIEMSGNCLQQDTMNSVSNLPDSGRTADQVSNIGLERGYMIHLLAILCKQDTNNVAVQIWTSDK